MPRSRSSEEAALPPVASGNDPTVAAARAATAACGEGDASSAACAVSALSSSASRARGPCERGGASGVPSSEDKTSVAVLYVAGLHVRARAALPRQGWASVVAGAARE